MIKKTKFDKKIHLRWYVFITFKINKELLKLQILKIIF